MTQEELKAYVTKQISNARTQKALDALSEYAAVSAKDHQSTVLQLAGRFRKNEKDNRLGLISQSDYNLENNRINSAILDTLDEMVEEEGKEMAPPDEEKEKHYKILFLASNPEDTGRLRLDEELREISEGLRRSWLLHRRQIRILPQI